MVSFMASFMESFTVSSKGWGLQLAVTGEWKLGAVDCTGPQDVATCRQHVPPHQYRARQLIRTAGSRILCLRYRIYYTTYRHKRTALQIQRRRAIGPLDQSYKVKLSCQYM